MHMGCHKQLSKWNAKVARKNFDIGEVWNQVCCYGNKTFKLVL